MKKKIIICGVIVICLCIVFIGKDRQTPVNENQKHFEEVVIENVMLKRKNFK